MITALAKSYTRGAGFDGEGDPFPDVAAVILGAAARLVFNPVQVPHAKSKGPFSIDYAGGFDGWSTAELPCLNRYRVRAL